MKTTTLRRHSRLGPALALVLTALAPGFLRAATQRNVIIFVADGLRGGSVNEANAPTMYDLQRRGVRFTNSHSLYPTVTTANASAIATGHALGDTGDFGNALFTGAPLAKPGSPENPSPVVFIENDAILRELNAAFGGNYLNEESLIAHARTHGYQTAVIGKIGPAAIQDVTQDRIGRGGAAADAPRTIIIDDATGSPNGIPLDAEVAQGLAENSLPAKTPSRHSKPGTQNDNGYAGDNKNAGTLVPNKVQQDYFASIATNIILPKFAKAGKPFVMLYWSRDPDGSQHDQGDSPNSLTPGINGTTSKKGIQNCDSNLSAILGELRTLGLEGNTDVFITADHGFDTISRQQVDAAGSLTRSYSAKLKYYDANGRQEVNTGCLPPGFLAIDLAHALGEPLFDPDTVDKGAGKYVLIDPDGGRPVDGTLQRPANGNGLIGGTGRIWPMTDARLVVANNGGTDFIYLPGDSGQNQPLVRRVVQILMQRDKLDYVSGIFLNDKYGEIPGTLKMSEINLIGEARPANSLPAPDIVVNFASFTTDPSNPLQNGVIVADGDLQQGQGNHGGFDRAATFNFMAARGPDFKSNYIDPAPVSNADIVPTLARILGFDIAARGNLRGRIIEEALLGGSGVAPGAVRVETSRSEPQRDVQTVLDWQEYGGCRYLDAGGFPGRTLGLRR